MDDPVMTFGTYIGGTDGEGACRSPSTIRATLRCRFDRSINYPLGRGRSKARTAEAGTPRYEVNADGTQLLVLDVPRRQLFEKANRLAVDAAAMPM